MTDASTFADFATRLREFIAASTAEATAPTTLKSAKGRTTARARPTAFEPLALDLFALQFEANPPLRRLCEARGVSPQTLDDWRRIPPMPTAAFKDLEVTCLAPAERRFVFHSSGTTGQRPSRHFHHAASLAIYEASLLPWFARHLELRSPARFVFLTPPPAAAPQSSLVHMFETVRREFGEALPMVRIPSPHPTPSVGERVSERRVSGMDGDSTCDPVEECPSTNPVAADVSPLHLPGREIGADSRRLLQSRGSPGELVRGNLSPFTGKLDADGAWDLDFEATIAALDEAVAAAQPLVLLGTAFSYVHLLDHLAARNIRLSLPPGSRVMETGGYKGRVRALTQAELHARMTDRLGVPPSHIVCEYGMSELSSQAYDTEVSSSEFRVSSSGGAASGSPRLFRFPPWVRVQVVSPEDGREVAEGETGLIRVFDLANVWSVLAIQTEDLGVRRGDGFGLIGRAAQSEPRGCSLMAVSDASGKTGGMR